MGLIDDLLKTAGPYFQEFRKLSVSCPKCDSQMVLKYASKPEYHNGRKLSIIMCCSKNCDRKIWNTDAKAEDFTHWWLDGRRNLEGFEKIKNLMNESEKKLIEELQKKLFVINLK